MQSCKGCVIPYFPFTPVPLMLWTAGAVFSCSFICFLYLFYLVQCAVYFCSFHYGSALSMYFEPWHWFPGTHKALLLAYLRSLLCSASSSLEQKFWIGNWYHLMPSYHCFMRCEKGTWQAAQLLLWRDEGQSGEQSISPAFLKLWDLPLEDAPILLPYTRAASVVI